ncbi:MAG: hypothetical protein IPP38_13085 [Bacteroidetes bacterium]|nr:hypothetical protein [Bacteroidota bacterium]
MIPGIIIYISVILIVSYFKSRARRKKEKELTEEAVLKATEKLSQNNWVAEWLTERGCSFFFRDSEDRKIYFADIDLQKCRAEGHFSLHHPYGNFIASVQLPIIVPKQKFRLIREFTDQHALYQSEFRLLLLEQTGKLIISFGVDGSYIMNLSKSERNEELEKLFSFTDDCFEEVGKILFAQRSPELACLKVMGFSKSALN